MKTVPEFASEADLCEAFAKDMRRTGWVVYPETAGFDMLLVNSEGHQLGIEAKLRLNMKVLQQILPSLWQSDDAPGPNHRAILVPSYDQALEWYLARVGIDVFQHCGCGSFSRPGNYGRTELYDWNPVKPFALPEFMPDVACGVPSPIRLTPWKIGALRVLAVLEIDGEITTKEIRGFGVDPRRFTGPDGWLISVGNGRYMRGSIPAFDQQHPDVYPQIIAKMIKSRSGAEA